MDVRLALHTRENPAGKLSINTLKLTGAVLAFLILEYKLESLKFAHIVTFCDNMSTVAWAYKLRTLKNPYAGRLLRLLGLRIHAAQASNFVPKHVVGVDNVMADIISCAFKTGKFFHAAPNLAHYFNQHFPLPQSKSWVKYRPPPALCLQ